MFSISRRLVLIGATLMAIGSLVVPASAADTTTSTNWAGYAVHGSTRHFRRVSGSWTVPTVDCTDTTSRRYSATWVGLGGWSSSSKALEQTGTEADCSSGRARYSSWYELVPDASHSAKLAVHAGDEMSASVTVTGHRVRLALADHTTGKKFSRTFTPSVVDTTSAEWIIEAPALCTSDANSSCTVQALANFGTQPITAAKATTTTGHVGTISDPRWSATAVNLRTSGDRSGVGDDGDSADGGGTATTGALDATGSAFAVTYDATSIPDGGASTGEPQFARARRTPGT